MSAAFGSLTGTKSLHTRGFTKFEHRRRDTRTDRAAGGIADRSDRHGEHDDSPALGPHLGLTTREPRHEQLDSSRSGTEHNTRRTDYTHSAPRTRAASDRGRRALTRRDALARHDARHDSRHDAATRGRHDTDELKTLIFIKIFLYSNRY